MFGSHVSVAGGLENGLDEAARLKMDCAQVFTRNQRQWKARPLAEDEIARWNEHRAAMGWAEGPDRLVSHNSYLINLANPDPAARAKSIAAQRAELERCEQLEIPLCVAHPGAHLGTPPPRSRPLDLDTPPGDDEKAGLERIADALDEIHRELPGYRVITCLETTAGTGTNLGYAFQHLAAIRDRVAEPERIAFCADTCHITAAGYDLSTDARAAAVIGRMEADLGADSVRVWHMNDSVGACGSRRDRHAHIGFGECGLACFRAVVNHPVFAGVPKILETEKGDNDKGVSWDVANIRRLKRLIRRPPARR